MSLSAQIVIIAMLAGATCSLAGLYLVLRKTAMVADAMSHALLPGLVLGFIVANGPNFGLSFAGATLAALITVLAVEALTSTSRLRADAAIGIVFPAMFALGVATISTSFSNVHLDTDAVLYGEIAFAPFDTLSFGGRDWGPTSIWLLGLLLVANAAFLMGFGRSLKAATFDPGFAATTGLRPRLVHYLLMIMVALTTVAAFSAVGAILTLGLIVTPAATALLLSRRYLPVIAISIVVGVVGAASGSIGAISFDVSISGGIGVVLGIIFLGALLFAPATGLVAKSIAARRRKVDFAAQVLLIHLAHHQGTEEEEQSSTPAAIVREFGWPPEELRRVATYAASKGWLAARNDRYDLSPAGADQVLAFSTSF